MFKYGCLLLLATCVCYGEGLENGLARTPPMGWMSWQRFRCVTDCVNFPNDCISDKLIRETTNSLVAEGYLAAGYEYVIIDDCWLARDRDEDGNLVADPDRFPNGMKSLADHAHGKGVKFGIYEDYGTKTCAGYPGIIGHMKQDAETFASWEVDYVKLDGCNADPATMDQGYPEFGQNLLDTKRPMIYSCSWPVYQDWSGMEPNFTLIAQHCNLWRNWGDIQDSYSSVRSIMDYFASEQDNIVPNAGPGHWNDPDMLIIGNFGLSLDQSRIQMAVWSILAAPLLLSNDLRNTRPEFKEILLNADAIAINQDELGIQGKRVLVKSDIEVWTKPVTPVVNGEHSYGVAFVSKRTDGTPISISVSLNDILLQSKIGYVFEEIFDDSEFTVSSGGEFTVTVNPTGVRFYKATVGISK